MKKLNIITSLFIILSANCYSQITTIAAPKEVVKEVLKYDSLESLTYENAPLHVGQTLFLKGHSYYEEHNFNGLFFTEMVTDSLIDARNDSVHRYAITYMQQHYAKNLHPQLVSQKDSIYVYRPISIKDKTLGICYRSDYSTLAGKYYKVISVKAEKSRYSRYIIYWLELLDEEKAPFYFRLEKISSNNRIFVTLGYYEKMKQIFVGKEFYSKGRYELDKIDTKDKVTLPFKIKFKCTDIAVNVGEDGPIFAVLENETHGRIKGEIIDGKALDNFITVSFYNECIRKYGSKFGNDVAKGRIELGMNKKMVIDAWGAPKDINITNGSFGTHEQWIYGDRYLYFENGRLASMQL